MNLLLITFSFPPAGGVGVLRALSLAKYLPQNGIRVHVLTARNAPSVGRDLSLLAEVPAEVNLHRTWTLDLPFGLRKLIKQLVSGRPSSPAPSPAATPVAGTAAAKSPAPTTQPLRPAPRGNPLKRLIANLLLPDPQIGWIPFALPAAKRLIRRHGIDAVLITVPPFSSAKLVTSLRRAFPSLPVVLDFRDEWLSTTLDLVSFNNNARARRIARSTERDAVHAATRIVLVTEAARAELIRRYPGEPATKFLCIYNGFDTPASPVATPSPTARPVSQPTRQSGADTAPVTLTYLGTVYGSTDPSTLVTAVHALPPALRARLRLRFIGHIETQALRDQLLSLGDTVELRGFLPQAEALRAMESTDWLLLVTRDRINVAAKFYDYLGGGKPILAFVHPEGDVRRLLEQTHAGLDADVFSPPAIAALLSRVLDPTAPGHVLPATITPDPSAIARFHRSALATRYADELHRLTRDRP